MMGNERPIPRTYRKPATSCSTQCVLCWVGFMLVALSSKYRCARGEETRGEGAPCCCPSDDNFNFMRTCAGLSHLTHNVPLNCSTAAADCKRADYKYSRCSSDISTFDKCIVRDTHAVRGEHTGRASGGLAFLLRAAEALLHCERASQVETHPVWREPRGGVGLGCNNHLLCKFTTWPLLRSLQNLPVCQGWN